jgi:uncharacterized membrane protein
MTTIEEKIKRIKVDCLYGKKKHFNAADRKEYYHYWIGIPLTAINIIIGTVLYYVLTHSGLDFTQNIPIFLSCIAAFLSGFQTFFNFNKKVEGHRRIGNRYLACMKKLDRLQAYIADGVVTNEDVIKKLEEISTDIDDINKESEQYHTSKKDYQKAKAGIDNGEESYTSSELEL